MKVRTAARRDARATGVGRRGVAMGGRRPIPEKAHEKARCGFLRAGLMISAMMTLCHRFARRVNDYFRKAEKLQKMQ
jgi:hypothetical protein